MNVTVEDIQRKLIEEIGLISADMLARVQNTVVKRLRRCIDVDGHVFEHLLK